MKEENDDIVIEDDPDSVAISGTIKKIREKLKLAEDKAKEYLDGWQRAQADFANLRRRDEESKLEFVKFANLNLVGELIPVLDSFNIALSQGHKDVEPLYNQLLGVLKNSGLEELDPIGEPFNPHEHEALSTEKTEDKSNDHKVLEVLQKGYKLGTRLVRPAKVKVGEFINNKE
ncbi:MAG: nucleotide exchange factor GrpE [Patescibacteria group bacterium]